MIVISDTTPIISLLKIDKLDLLRELYSEVVIPEAVYAELAANEDFATEAETVKNSPYVVQRAVENRKAVSVLQRATGLHLGESEAIVLADEIKADLVLMDELPGRTVAQNMDLECTGTIGVLAAAKTKGFLTKEDLETSVKVLKENGRHISDALYKQLLSGIGR